MNAYTVSRLAHDAGVSVHIVRDYVLRGMLRPVARTAGGYGVVDANAWQRLCFVRDAFDEGIGLDALARLCPALDAADGDTVAEQLAVLRQLVERWREALASVKIRLPAMPAEPAQQVEICHEQPRALAGRDALAGHWLPKGFRAIEYTNRITLWLISPTPAKRKRFLARALRPETK